LWKDSLDQRRSYEKEEGQEVEGQGRKEKDTGGAEDRATCQETEEEAKEAEKGHP
jgi:hypothetical protein